MLLRGKGSKNVKVVENSTAAPTRANENGALDRSGNMKVDPQAKHEAGSQLVLCFEARVGNWSGARLLEPATVVSAPADEHEYECHLPLSRRPFARGLFFSKLQFSYLIDEAGLYRGKIFIRRYGCAHKGGWRK